MSQMANYILSIFILIVTFKLQIFMLVKLKNLIRFFSYLDSINENIILFITDHRFYLISI